MFWNNEQRTTNLTFTKESHREHSGQNTVNEGYFCFLCGEIVQLHRLPPIRCRQCSQGWLEKVDKNDLQVAQEQSDERIIQPAFDSTVQTNPSLLVNQFGVIVTANEVQNKAQLEKSKIKTQFPSREATSDITDPQVSLKTSLTLLDLKIPFYSYQPRTVLILCHL